MNTSSQNDSDDLPVIEPDTDSVYSLELVAKLTGISSQTILHYREQGLIFPVQNEESDSEQFDDEALRTLRRIEHLQTQCEMNEAGLKLMLNLLDEIEHLREELRSG